LAYDTDIMGHSQLASDGSDDLAPTADMCTVVRYRIAEWSRILKLMTAFDSCGVQWRIYRRFKRFSKSGLATSKGLLATRINARPNKWRLALKH